jgi:hypothetical protein
MATKAGTERQRNVATPWGAAVVTDEVRVAQRSGERRFATVVQILESEAGDLLVRIAYTTDGTVRRGPVTLRGRDLERLRAALADRPAFAGVLGLGGGGA